MLPDEAAIDFVSLHLSSFLFVTPNRMSRRSLTDVAPQADIAPSILHTGRGPVPEEIAVITAERLERRMAA